MADKPLSVNNPKRRSSFEWLYTNKSIAVISVLLAIACWVLMTIYVNDDSTSVVKDVPIRINTGDIEEFHDLQMISIVSPETLINGRVDVEVSGSIHEISRVTAEDINVTASVGSVNTSGEHSLSLSVACPGHNVTVRIKDGYSAVRVWFDRVLQKNLSVSKVVVNGVSTESNDIIIGDYYSSVKTLAVQGPQSIVEQLDGIVITADVNRELSASEVDPAQISYVDSEGNAIPEERIKWLTITDYNDIGGETGTPAGEPPADFVTVTIPIRKTAVLPVNVPIKNLPEGFDISSLKYSVSPANLSLEGDIDAINKLISAGSYTVEGVDLSALSVSNRTFTFALNLAAGIEELNGVTEVTVTFNIGSYAAKTIPVANNGTFWVMKSNGISGDIMSDSLEITVVGPRDEVSDLTERNVSVAVDMSTYDGASGQRKMPAVIKLNGTDSCWVYGSYTLTVSPKTEY